MDGERENFFTGKMEASSQPEAGTITTHGNLQGPLSELFPDVDYSQVRSMRIRSDLPIVCCGSIFGPDRASLVTMAGRNVALPSKVLYFPHFAEGDGCLTAVGVRNMTASETAITLTAYKDDGTPLASPVTRAGNPVTRSAASRNQREVQAGFTQAACRAA